MQTYFNIVLTRFEKIKKFQNDAEEKNQNFI